MLLHEREAWSQGYLTLAGVDEAGRGPLAGPVVAAAVVIPRDVLEAEHTRLFSGIADSKTLTAKRRESLFARLSEESSVARGVGLADVAEIDSLNILRATHLAMKRAVEALGRAADLILVDGRPVPGLPFASRAIVKGDAQSLLIAAASIVAKVTRDHWMDELDRQYPRYGFARHKGYGTAEHLAALREWGPTPVHRRSFAPVAAAQRPC
ncbi:MAG: ribonuclease HII [Kiritimatiellae bacterium]|nr:ribonuclease HII [Kiritimatiellia bacterium]